MKLVVTHAFGDHKPGDEITDAKQIEAVLESHPGSVVKVASAPTEAPAAGKRG
ncbi:hypothetical protein LJR084_001920 [Variovorax sp. LjRoot84]|uniref:hypothetical protein n=1 Tax=Variovorax sp. LjRoot84 TaxID=3342340 RepID=UPI003ED0EAFA